MDAGNTLRLDRGVFTISIDLELIWGTLDLFGPNRFRKACLAERAVVVDRLLDLLAAHEVPATWCVLGHLFLDRCSGDNGLKHPEIVRPTHSWHEGDWFKHDPCGDEQTAGTFVGRSLVEKIRACPVPQEIGSHTFSHAVFGDAGCSRETAESEIAECVRLARDAGISLRSFAFPRNSVGHLEVLSRFGFACYRGPEPLSPRRQNWPHSLRRLANLGEVLAAARPPVVTPEKTAEGVWNIPGSMIYFPAHGFRRLIPVSLRVKRATKGLEAAAREKRIFHLWFHPFNLVARMEGMFDGLRKVLERADRLRAENQLAILPMGSLVPADSAAAPFTLDELRGGSTDPGLAKRAVLDSQLVTQ